MWVSWRKRPQPPEPDSLITLKSVSGTFRTLFLRAEHDAWVIAAPLKKGSRVVLACHEPLLVEIPARNGALAFRTAVLARNPEKGEVALVPPRNLTRRERRAEPRLAVPDVTVALDGARAWLANLSRSGARVESSSPVRRGDRVRLDVPWTPEPIFAYVLDTEAEARAGAACAARVRFEQVIELPRQEKSPLH